MKSDNIVVRTIINMEGIGGFHSVMGRNIRLMQSRFKMAEINVLQLWNDKCENENDTVILSVQVRVRCEWTDNCDFTFLDKVECKLFLTFYVLIEF